MNQGTQRGLRLVEPPDPKEGMTALIRACRAAQLPVTPQRVAVLRAVLGLPTHPTADEVLAHLKGEGVEISRATVFRTLDGLVELGLISRTCHPGRSVRYDRITHLHHHLVCVRCHAMTDFTDDFLDALPLPDASSLGFRVAGFGVQVRGLCADCQKEEP